MKVNSKTAAGDDIVCFVRKPNAKDNRDAKLYGNQLAAQIMLKKDVDGKPTFITRSQVRSILRDTGRLSEEEEQNIHNLTTEIRELEDKLTKGGTKKSVGRDLAIQLRDKRNTLLFSLININELDEHTLEFEVENATFDYLVSVCATTESGDKLFESVDDYKSKADDEPYAYETANALKIVLYGTTEDMLRDNIENKFLTKYGYIDSKLRLIDKDGNLIDRYGHKINDDGELLDEDGQKVQRIVELGDFEDDEVPDEQLIESPPIEVEVPPLKVEKPDEELVTV